MTVSVIADLFFGPSLRRFREFWRIKIGFYSEENACTQLFVLRLPGMGNEVQFVANLNEQRDISVIFFSNPCLSSTHSPKKHKKQFEQTNIKKWRKKTNNHVYTKNWANKQTQKLKLIWTISFIFYCLSSTHSRNMNKQTNTKTNFNKQHKIKNNLKQKIKTNLNKQRDISVIFSPTPCFSPSSTQTRETRTNKHKNWTKIKDIFSRHQSLTLMCFGP